MQSKTMMRHHYKTYQNDQISRPSVDKEVEHLKSSHIGGQNGNMDRHLGKQSGSFS